MTRDARDACSCRPKRAWAVMRTRLPHKLLRLSCACVRARAAGGRLHRARSVRLYVCRQRHAFHFGRLVLLLPRWRVTACPLPSIADASSIHCCALLAASAAACRCIWLRSHERRMRKVSLLPNGVDVFVKLQKKTILFIGWLFSQKSNLTINKLFFHKHISVVFSSCFRTYGN